MRPFSEADGLDGVGECCEVVPRGASGIDDVVHVVEDGVGQPISAEELPDVFDWVQFGSARWQKDQADVARQPEFGCRMPWCPIEQNDGMGSPSYTTRNLVEVQLHAARADKRECEACGLAPCGTDGGIEEPLIDVLGS